MAWDVDLDGRVTPASESASNPDLCKKWRAAGSRLSLLKIVTVASPVLTLGTCLRSRNRRRWPSHCCGQAHDFSVSVCGRALTIVGTVTWSVWWLVRNVDG
jgi:hypothetical protein